MQLFFECIGEGIDYNEKYPIEGSKCKCDIIDDNLPENVLIGDCADKPLYNGETCNLTCKDGYTLSGEQPQCFENRLEMGNVTCSDVGELAIYDSAVYDPVDGNEVCEENTEGFSNAFSINSKRLFLVFLLIILILNIC